MPETIEIALLDYEGVQEAASLGLTDLFRLANRAAEPGRPSLNVLRLKCDKSRRDLLNGLDGTGVHSVEVVIIPPGLDGPLASQDAVIFAPGLCRLHEGGATLASVCSGAFILGETGLLSGRNVTTHWAFENEFKMRFPGAKLDVDSLVIDNGDILTAGGIMAWTDLGLKLVDRYLGSSTMIAVAQMLLIDPPGREQRYYSGFVPRLQHGDAGVLAAQHRIHASFDGEISIGDLSEEAGLEERTFLRRFKKATGMTAVEYLQRFRMNKAKEILQFEAASSDEVAWRVGYSDAGAFRKVFQRIVGLTPAEFKRRFHA